MNAFLRTAITASFACAALGGASGAAAQSGASVYFDSFDYQITDLTPGDGIDAGIAFLGGTITGVANFYDDPYSGGTPRESVSNSSPSGAIQLSIDTLDSHFAGSATQTSGLAQLLIGHGAGYISTDATDAFVLQPNTQITFTIHGSVDEHNPPGLPESSSFATLALSGRLQYADGTVVETNRYLFSDDGPSSGPLSVTLTSGATSQTGELEFRTTAAAQVLAVPEPAAPAMLLGGLGLLAAVARRKTR